MISKLLTLFLLLCLLLPCVASAAMVEYPQEYKDISAKLEVLDPDKTTNFPIIWAGMIYWDIGSYYELRRHTILLERQNELIAEQNALLRNMTARCG